ncbi:carbon-nitrogen hydrolase family protein [Paludibaculum fermentans]|uniref:carbon-nitrogen hydrolase family protein n=1 Tax=Paludibaculum fermentans TaxID=1473598 RepID=UPI003EBE3E8A
MKSNVRVAAVCAESHPARTEENLQAIRRCTRQAAEQGADIVLLPELSVTGFIPNHPVGDHAAWLRAVLQGAWGMAEPLEGPAVRELAAISAEAGVFLAAGLLENAGNVLFNTHVLVGEGRLLGFWRKMHIPMFEMAVYNGGGVPTVVDTPLGRIGVNICFDALLPESTRLLAVQGCEIALFPFAADPAPGTAEAWGAWARPVLQARCAENGIYGVACNYLGDVAFAGASQSFAGGAMTLGPGGAVLAEATGPMLVSDFPAQGLLDARAAFEYSFRFRRPELYGSLAR